MVTVKGAAHNSFNSQWHWSDGTHCVNQIPLYSRASGSHSNKSFGSPWPRLIMRQIATHFFGAFVGQQPSSDLLRIFDPLNRFPVPPFLQASVVREFLAPRVTWLRGLVDGIKPKGFVRVLKPPGCYQRALAISWNSCFPDNMSRPDNTCLQPDGSLTCMPGYKFDIKGQRCVSAAWADLQSLRPALPPMLRALPALVVFRFEETDVGPSDSISFSVGRINSMLNVLTSTDFTIEMLGFSFDVSTCLRRNGVALDGPVGVLYGGHKVQGNGAASSIFTPALRSRPSQWGSFYFPTLHTCTLRLDRLTNRTTVSEIRMTLDSYVLSGAILIDSFKVYHELPGLFSQGGHSRKAMGVQHAHTMNLLLDTASTSPFLIVCVAWHYGRRCILCLL
jgi:hypothetical protein